MQTDQLKAWRKTERDRLRNENRPPDPVVDAATVEAVVRDLVAGTA